MKTLKLTLKKQSFDVMVTGEKCEEFREPSQWMLSRLYCKDGTRKHYDRIEYTNGYGSDRPTFTTDFCGFELVEGGVERVYSNNLKIASSGPLIVIHHSQVLRISNGRN